MVQHNAARFISNNYFKKGNFIKTSITKILNDLQMETLEQRRTKIRLSMAYKIINGKVILDPNMLPKIRNTRQPHRECNTAKVGIENQLFEPASELKMAAKTFFYSIPKIWNQSVTPLQAKAPSVDAFREHFKRNTK